MLRAIHSFPYGLAKNKPTLLCLCRWAFEAIVLAAGLLPDAELSLAVVGVLLNIGNWLFALPNGLGSEWLAR